MHSRQQGQDRATVHVPSPDERARAGRSRVSGTRQGLAGKLRRADADRVLRRVATLADAGEAMLMLPAHPLTKFQFIAILAVEVHFQWEVL